jgi:hypothetical protein
MMMGRWTGRVGWGGWCDGWSFLDSQGLQAQGLYHRVLDFEVLVVVVLLGKDRSDGGRWLLGWELLLVEAKGEGRRLLDWCSLLHCCLFFQRAAQLPPVEMCGVQVGVKKEVNRASA